jgi:four helix bundle protein
MRDFRKIKAWQACDDLAVEIYRVTADYFPDGERFGLTSQIRRAVVSAAANIAEGAKRKSTKDYLRFLYNSRGSPGEVEYYIHVANRLGLLPQQVLESLEELQDKAARTLYKLIEAIETEV